MDQHFNLEPLVRLHPPLVKAAEPVGGSSSSGGSGPCPDGTSACGNGLQPHGPFWVVGHGPQAAHEPALVVVMVVTYLLTFGVGFLVGRLSRSRAGTGAG